MYFFIFVVGFFVGIWSLRLLHQKGQTDIVKRILGMEEPVILTVPIVETAKLQPRVIEKVQFVEFTSLTSLGGAYYTTKTKTANC